ncbi:MAG: O-antigen/teichoic acid export membrane protein [Sphingobacteriales bacterium]|jgi:O-antigen/teichoic acid export membrane protein
MFKKFVSGLGIILGLNLLIKPIWIFFIDLRVQNELGPEVYGEYFALLNFTFLWNILLDIGITNFNNRNIAQNNALLSKHHPKILSLRFIMGAFYLLFCLLMGLLLDYSPNQLKLICWLAFNQFLSLLILYLRSNISGLLMFKLDAIFSVLDRLLMTLGMAVVLFFPFLTGDLSIEQFIGVQTGAYLISAIILLVVVSRKAKGLKKAWHLPFKLVVLKKSFPFAILVLLMTLYTRTDAVMIERLCDFGAHESGVYARSFRLLEALNMVAFLFAGLLLPLFSKMIADKKRVQAIAGIAFRVLFSGAWIAIGAAYFFGDLIIGFLYPDAGLEDANILKGLMWAFMGMSTTYVFGTLLTANGNLGTLNKMALVGVVVNVGLNLWMIPRMGAMGAVIATAVTQIGTAVFQMVLCHTYFGFEIPMRATILQCLFVLVCPLIFWLVFSWNQSFWGLTSGLVIALILVFASKMVHLKSLIHLFKDENEGEKI